MSTEFTTETANLKAGNGASPNRVTELEGLRGMLAWWVVIGHILTFAAVPTHWFLPLRLLGEPALAVEVFIILSGFVIFMTVDRHRDGYGPFLLRRFFRLFPAYVICLVATIIILRSMAALMTNTPAEGVQGVLGEWRIASVNLWQHLLLHLTMLHGVVPEEVLPRSGSAILGPAWSISLEWQFYLVAPLLWLACRRDVRWFMAIGAITAVCAYTAPLFGDMFTKGKIVTYYLPSFLPLRAGFFFLGAISYYLWRESVKYRAPELTLRIWIIILVLTTAFARSLPVLIWTSVLGVHLLRRQGYRSKITDGVTGVLNSPLLQWIGRISYSTYLCHGPLICVVALLMHWGFPAWAPLKCFAVVALGTIPLTLLLSHLLFRYVETPFNVLAKEWAAGWPKSTLPVTAAELAP